MIAEIAERLAHAERILFITGAGISADSGLPTYRGIGGLYECDETDDGIPIEVALSGDMMRRRPDITWRHLADIERHCRGAQPNAAHEVIAALERRIPFVLVFTQNVDGFHDLAGSSNVAEIHGNLRDLVCTGCDFATRVDDYAGFAIPPTCPECGSIVRPAVVLFGESLPAEPLVRLETAMGEGFDLVFSIGTSSLFPYIAEPVIWAQESGIPTVEINPGETTISGLIDYHLTLGAAEAMTRLHAALRAITGTD